MPTSTFLDVWSNAKFPLQGWVLGPLGELVNSCGLLSMVGISTAKCGLYTYIHTYTYIYINLQTSLWSTNWSRIYSNISHSIFLLWYIFSINGGTPQFSSILDWDFLWNKPSSDQGYPHDYGNLHDLVVVGSPTQLWHYDINPNPTWSNG